MRKLAINPKMQLEATNDKTKFETRAVGIALAKIMGLMQLGFGGAGHEIIASNLAGADGKELDLLRKGRKMDCAYGFCDIRQFTDTVECLQDQVGGAKAVWGWGDKAKGVRGRGGTKIHEMRHVG